jgi:hypothetical protein
MEKFIKKHFKFVFVMVWFTFLVSGISKEIFRKNEFIESKMMSIDYMQDKNMEYILTRFKDLEKKLNEIKTSVGISTEVLFDEIKILDAYQYVTYSEIIKCLNNCYHNSDYEKIDFMELSKSIYKYYFDVKKEKCEQRLKECSEKKIKIETH